MTVLKKYKLAFERNVAVFRYSGNSVEAVTTCIYCGKPEHLYFNVTTGRWLCFRCGEGGSAIRFFMDLRGINYWEAVRLVEGHQPHLTFEAIKERIMQIKAHVDFFESTDLPKIVAEPPKYAFNKRIRGWLERKRKIPFFNLGIKDVEVGQCTQQWNDDKGTELCPHYMRAVFAFNCAGHVSFQSYALNSFQYPKMLNPGRTMENPTGKTNPQLLFGYNDVRDEGLVVLTEGIFDMARLRQYGYPSVAAFGARLTPNQVLLLCGSKAKEVNISFDSDDAGREGALKAAARLARGFDGEVTCTVLPSKLGYKDPDKTPKSVFKDHFDRRCGLRQLRARLLKVS